MPRNLKTQAEREEQRQRRRAFAVTIDWRATFAAFCAEHGEPAVRRTQDGALLVFRDGWTHSATDYKGPAWQPPQDADALRLLQAEYWTLRRQALRAKLLPMLLALDELTRLQAAVPHLRRVVRGQDLDEATGAVKPWVGSEPLDLDGMRWEADLVTQAVEECDAALAELAREVEACFNGEGQRVDEGVT